MKSGFSCFSKIVVFGLSCASFVTVVACSPEPAVRTFDEAPQEFGPVRSGGDISIAEINTSALPSRESVRWKGDIETASWYRATDDLTSLSRLLGQPLLLKLSSRMREAVGQSSVAWGHVVGRSAYASAAIGETRADTKDAIAEGVGMLKAQEPILTQLLAARSAKMNWPNERASLVSVVSLIETFLVGFVKDVEKNGEVDKAVKKQLIEELRVTFGPKLRRIRIQVALAYSEKKTYRFVARIRQILKSEGIDLGPNIEPQLALAERLPREVERIHDARSALSVLVDFWMASSQKVRETKFKVLAPDLYDFFDGQNKDDLECIKSGCGLITRIKRFLFILPKIDEYGIEKIRNQLSTAAEDSIRSELELQAVQFLPDFHKEVDAKIREEIGRQRSNITKIGQDYGAYMRVVLGRMAVAKLGLREKDMFAGAEPNRIRVDLDFGTRSTPNENVKVLRVPSVQNLDGFETGAAAMGSGLAAALQIHDHGTISFSDRAGGNPIRAKQAQARLFFEQINKVLMIGGFQGESSQLFESFSLPLSAVRARASVPRFNLRTMISSGQAFGVPDQLILKNATKADRVVESTAAKSIAISVAGQAEMIRGLSRLAGSLRDWESTPFDKVLGTISVADFVPDLPREAVDRALFPKDLFFAAAIGNAAAILQNMTRDLTPVALIGPDRAIRWSNTTMAGGDESPEKMAVLATVFDIVNGERQSRVKTVDVARFIMALAEFLRATEGLENTRAEILRVPNSEGVSPLDQLNDAKVQLRQLVMALANFLWLETVGPDGLVRPEYNRFEGVAMGAAGEPRLLDQAIVVRAFLDASEVISAGMFRTAALDLMSATNRALFRTELGFYADRVGTSETPNLETLLAILTAGERLKPNYSPERAAEWTTISRPWINALRDAAETLP